MNRIDLYVLLTALPLFIAPLTINASEKWERVKQKNGIDIYTRPFEGSDIDEFKGSMTINARIESVLAVFIEIEKQTEWMDKCIDAKLVKKINDFEGFIYNVTELPWPFGNRDVVVRQFFRVDEDGRVIIDFHAAENAEAFVPKRDGYVRMTELVGQWKLFAVGRNKTRATYKIRLNPAGMIPTWLANYASRNIPYNTLQSLAENANKQYFVESGRELRTRYDAITRKMIIGRLKSNAAGIGDTKLIALLQNDRQLIDTILKSEGEVRPIVHQWVANYYQQENGAWVTKKQEPEAHTEISQRP